MHEDYFLSCKVFAFAAWTVVAGLLMAAWIVMLLDPGDWRLAVLLLETACVGSAVACVLHVRSYVIRVCAVIRASRVEDESPAARSLRSM